VRLVAQGLFKLTLLVIVALTMSRLLTLGWGIIALTFSGSIAVMFWSLVTGEP